MGKYQLINYHEGYEGIGIGLFTRVLGWNPAEVQVLIAKLRGELKDRTIHAYQVLYASHLFFPHHWLLAKSKVGRRN